MRFFVSRALRVVSVKKNAFVCVRKYMYACCSAHKKRRIVMCVFTNGFPMCETSKKKCTVRELNPASRVACENSATKLTALVIAFFREIVQGVKYSCAKRECGLRMSLTIGLPSC